MDFQNNLLDQTREKLRAIAKRLDDELSTLQGQGVLTLLDKQKMVTDAQTSGKAILDALNRDDYPREMQQELIDRLIIQFENSVDNIIRQARLRKYARARLVERFSSIENSVLNEHRNLSERSIYKARSEFRRLQNTFIARIELLITRGNANEAMIEPLFEQYRSDLDAIVSSFLPKLGKVVDESSPKGQPISNGVRRPVTSRANTEPPKQSRIRFDNIEDVQKKTQPAERSLSGIKVILLVIFILLCSIVLIFNKFIFFLIRFPFR